MTTPVFLTGFEHQILSTNGGGILTNVIGGVTIDTTHFHSGLASLEVDSTSSLAANGRLPIPANQEILIFSLYIMIPSGGIPNVPINFFGVRSVTGGYFSGIRITDTGIIGCTTGSSGTIVNSDVTMVENQWYLIDFKVSQAGTIWTVDWAIDGVPQTQVVATGQIQDFISYNQFGSTSSSITILAHIDDVIISATPADYPIGDHETEILIPESDGTHNSGTNTMENQDGTDLGTAWSLIDDIPMSLSTEYIKQSSVGIGNYGEILFGNMVNPNSGILGCMGFLAYTSSAAQLNRGGCILSKDDFVTHSVLFGESGALADYSDGATNNLFYRSAVIDGADTEVEVNALKARFGYSSDVTPIPYWVNLAVEVAYVPSDSSVISLDLVSYTSTFNDINVLESEIISLDLVSYTSTFNDINVLESEIISLDLVSYTSTFNDINVLESEIISLDLVSYTSTFNDINVLESEIISLDLVSYTSTFNDINVLESEIISLDLVSYTSTFNDINVLESEIISLDLVSYTSTFNDINVLESEIISLDLVSYTSTFNDIVLVEESSVMLDLVIYTSIFNDINFFEISSPPLERCYSIVEETRLFAIEDESRVFSILKEERTYNIE